MGFLDRFRKKGDKKTENKEEVNKPVTELEKMCGDAELYNDLGRMLPLNLNSAIKIPTNDNPSASELRKYAAQLKNKGDIQARNFYDLAMAKALMEGNQSEIQTIYDERKESASSEPYAGIMRDIGRAIKVTTEFYAKQAEQKKKEAEQKKETA